MSGSAWARQSQADSATRSKIRNRIVLVRFTCQTILRQKKLYGRALEACEVDRLQSSETSEITPLAKG